MLDLFQVSPYDIDQFLRGGRLRGILAIVGIEHMKPHVALNQFRHQTVQGTAASSHELENFEAFVLFVQGTLERFDLSPNSANAEKEFLTVFRGVCHRYTIGEYSNFGKNLNSRRRACAERCSIEVSSNHKIPAKCQAT
jgi:hypothetical protein